MWVKCHFLFHCLFLIIIYFQHRGGRFSDAEGLCHTEADEPDDGAGGIGEHQLTALLKDVPFLVGEEVTDQFLTIHAERLETVALLHRTESQRETYLGGIEGGDMRIATDTGVYF